MRSVTSSATGTSIWCRRQYSKMATSNRLASERVSAAAAASQARRHWGVSLMVATSVLVLLRATRPCAFAFRYCLCMALNFRRATVVGDCVLRNASSRGGDLSRSDDIRRLVLPHEAPHSAFYVSAQQASSLAEKINSWSMHALTTEKLHDDQRFIDEFIAHGRRGEPRVLMSKIELRTGRHLFRPIQ